jgi:hypothetical protein
MTDQERNDEGAEEAIEDLDAPADAQGDVAGGMVKGPLCAKPPSCARNTMQCTADTVPIPIKV